MNHNTEPYIILSQSVVRMLNFMYVIHYKTKYWNTKSLWVKQKHRRCKSSSNGQILEQ